MFTTPGPILRSAFALCVIATAARAVAQDPRRAPTPTAPAGGKPDLVLTSFGLSSWGKCAAGQTVFTFQVGVKNAGTASWSGVEPAVVVKDMHPGVLDAWGTGIGVDPPLKPGETRLLTVPVAFFSANPSHMTSGAPHPFRASVNDNHVVAESDFGNNAGPGPATWSGMKVIEVGAPQGCPQPARPVPK